MSLATKAKELELKELNLSEKIKELEEKIAEEARSKQAVIKNIGTEKIEELESKLTELAKKFKAKPLLRSQKLFRPWPAQPKVKIKPVKLPKVPKPAKLSKLRIGKIPTAFKIKPAITKAKKKGRKESRLERSDGAITKWWKKSHTGIKAIKTPAHFKIK